MDQNTPNQQTEPIVEDLQQKIAAVLGITDLNDQKQKEIIEKATEVLLKKIFLQTIDKLSDEDVTKYEELLDKEVSPEEIEKFLNEKIPGRTDSIQKTVDDFINDIKTAAAAE